MIAPWENPECHFGDHYYENNGRCRDCYHFSGAWLAWQAQEKAEREGRAHYGHRHRSIEAKQACRRKPDAEWIEAYGTSEVPA